MIQVLTRRMAMPRIGQRLPFELTWQEQLGIVPLTTGCSDKTKDANKEKKSIQDDIKTMPNATLLDRFREAVVSGNSAEEGRLNQEICYRMDVGRHY